MPDFDFSFAVVNWNTCQLLDDCLDSIQREAGHLRVQVLVADNASEDGSADMVAEKYPSAVLVRNPGNLGFAKGHEPLFTKSRGKYHVLVNSDVRLQPGCLEQVYQRLKTEPDIGILGCRILGPDGNIQPSCRRFPNLRYQLIEASAINRLFPHTWLNAYKMGGFDHLTARDVDQVMGSFFVIRHELIQEIGILDTAFFMYYEEVDYCFRAREAGYRTFYEPRATVWHAGGASAKKVRVLTIRRTFRSMRHYFQKRWGIWTWPPLLIILSLDLATHFTHALATRHEPVRTLQAYALAWWDVLLRRGADT